TDTQGWNQIPYYGSLRLADVNGDGKPDLCGRGTTGIICAPGNGDGTFGTLQQWDTNFSDAQGWNLAQYGTTMMFADLNGDGKMDVCGRGTAGILCALSNGTSFGPIFQAINQFTDAQGWNQVPYYGSLRLADVNGDGRPEVCGRGTAGVICAPWQLN
ncbi:MAG TPA: VCBS repeat-containing protein, partial [Candidatus Angelobacter sp.]|nr:VCBS repeat-containing protein [Candidatus Angelobacter sp.]